MDIIWISKDMFGISYLDIDWISIGYTLDILIGYPLDIYGYTVDTTWISKMDI